MTMSSDFCIEIPQETENGSSLYSIYARHGSFQASLDETVEKWLRQNVKGTYNLKLTV